MGSLTIFWIRVAEIKHVMGENVNKSVRMRVTELRWTSRAVKSEGSKDGNNAW